MVDDTVVVPEEDALRQAVASLRGYAYQIYSSALAWSALRGEEILLLEVAEDFSVLSADALALRQVKDAKASGNVSLRTPSIVSSINAYWRFKKANPSRNVTLCFLTTADIGAERGGEFFGGSPGLKYWREAARGRPVECLVDFMLGLEIDSDLREWLSAADEESIKEELLRPIRWECGQPDAEAVEKLLDEAIVLICEGIGIPPSYSSIARDAIILETLKASTEKINQNRQKSRAQLLKIIEDSTSIRIPIAQARRLSLQHPTQSEFEFIEPLRNGSAGRWLVDRPEAIKLVRGALVDGQAWLYGASGAGKTALARAATQQANREWFGIDLRDLGAADAKRRLREARRQLRTITHLAGVLVDDFPTGQYASLRDELGLLREALARDDAMLLVAAYRKPPPSLMADLDFSAEAVVEAPYFSEDEVASLIGLAGGDPSLWLKAVHALSGGGHPQLVAARVVGLRARKWPTSELTDGLLGAGPKDVEEEREAVRLRLINDLPDGARSLLYRVSLLTGSFDRQMAMATASVAPAIAEAGGALDLLAGPWVEIRGGGRFRVSPLVSSAGAQALSPAEIRDVQLGIINDLIGRNPFPAEYLTQLLISSLGCGDADGLKMIVHAVFSGALSDEALATTLFLLPLLKTQEPIFPADAKLNRILRLAQLKIACIDGRAKQVEPIYRRLLEELSQLADEDIHRSGAAYFMMSAENYFPKPSKWFEYLGDIERANFTGVSEEYGRKRPARKKSQPGTHRESLNFDGLTAACGVFALRAGRIQGIGELADLFTALDTLDVERRTKYLAALHQSFGGRYIPVQMAWVRSSEEEAFEPLQAAKEYQELADVAAKWGDANLELECIRCRATILAEYAGDTGAALDVLAEAAKRWPDSVWIKRDQSKVLFQQGNYAEVAARGDALLSEASNVAGLEAVNVLREIAVSSAETGDVERAIELLREAEAQASNLDMAGLLVGLAADKAFLVWRSGRREEGMAGVLQALLSAEELPSDDSRADYVMQAIGLTVRCMYQDVAWVGWDKPFPTVFGIASRPAQQWEGGEKPTVLSIWYQFAALEATTKIFVGAANLLDKRRSGKYIVDFEFIRFNYEFLKDIEQGNVQKILNNVGAFANMMKYIIGRKASDDDGPEIKFDVVSTLPWDVAFSADDEHQRRVLEAAILLGAAFAYARGDIGWIERLRGVAIQSEPFASIAKSLPAPESYERNGPMVAAYLWTLRVLYSTSPTAEDAFFALARLFEWAGDTLDGKALARILGPVAAANWRYVVNNAKFSLRTPSLSGPEILAASENVVTRAAIGQLLLAASRAVNISLPPSLIQTARDLKNDDSL